MILLSDKEQITLNLLLKNHDREFLQLLQMFHKFTYVENKCLLEPPFFLITKVYMLDRIIVDSIASGQIIHPEPRQLCANIIKHLFSTHADNLPDQTTYRFYNMVDSLIHILEIGNDNEIDNDNIIIPEKKSSLCNFLSFWKSDSKVIPTNKMVYRRRENRDRVHPQFFIHCNYIHSQLNIANNSLKSKATAKDKLGRIIREFSIVTQISSSIKHSIINSFEKSCSSFSISKNEFDWLKKTICFAEYLPVSISISIAKREYPNFPLIYVNRKFESLTQYNRDEVIGKNCKFLQPSVPRFDEVLQHKILSNCLANIIPVSVIITNHKKDGTQFYNLLSMNPVCDSSGNYLYVVGIQTSISNSLLDSNIRNIQNVIDIMYLLSNMTNDYGFGIEDKEKIHMGTSSY